MQTRTLFFFLFFCWQLPTLSAQDSLEAGDGETVRERYALVYADSAHQKKEGKVTAHYAFDPGRLAVEQYYKNGRKNGVYKAYYPSGNLMEFGVYGNGVRHGEWTWYDESGNILVKGKYKEGKEHGFWAYLKKECHGHYRNGHKSGKWICYVNRERIRTYYKKGEEQTRP